MNNLQAVSMEAAKAVMAAIENAGIDTASVTLNPTYGVLYFSGSACGAIDLNVGEEDPDYYWLSTPEIDDVSGVHLRNIQQAYMAYSAAIMAAVYEEELPEGWIPLLNLWRSEPPTMFTPQRGEHLFGQGGPRWSSLGLI